NHEYRVGATPSGVEELTRAGHKVLITKGAGEGSGFSDTEYVESGASIVASNKELYSKAEMFYKIKEPLEEEYSLLKKGQIGFTYYHFASDEKLTMAMIKAGIIAIAYETIELEDGSLPLLEPMSEVAGRMASIMGAFYLARPFGGRGVLISGVPGVAPAKTVILGGGTVGLNAAKIAAGMGSDVTILQRGEERMRYLSDILPPNVKILKFNTHNVETLAKEADILICGILIPGAKAPKVITRKILKTMKKGSVIVDVSVDQGGCAESTRPTFHSDPIYTEEGVIHYCVANMPGAYSRTSTVAITNRTLPYALEIANKGYKKALLENKSLLKGLNIIDGKVTNRGVAEAFNLEYVPPESMLKG
ncbi:MAG: alanine dehydrogenase, partial [Candidatus Bathyarchaeia archaeon]